VHGNVREWCADWFEDRYYQQSARQEPRGPDAGTYRVLRGGSWKDQRQPFLGFRVVLIVSE
jgi:sulfatase modifying factor 1